MEGESEGSYGVGEWINGREVEEAIFHRVTDLARRRGRHPGVGGVMFQIGTEIADETGPIQAELAETGVKTKIGEEEGGWERDVGFSQV